MIGVPRRISWLPHFWTKTILSLRGHHLNPLVNIASILVVCDGNHCRSPIGEALLRRAMGDGMLVGSAGLMALHGAPAAPEALTLMSEMGLDISRHRGRQLTAAMALEADLILVMDERQKADCERMVPSTRGRVYLLGHWQSAASREIADPFQKGPAAFRRALEQISRSVADWPSHLVHKQRSA